MKLLIASDLHGACPKAAFLAERMADMRPDYCVLLGDILYHGPRNPLPEGYDPAATADCLNAFASRILAVNGNCDSDVDRMVLRFPLAPRFAWLLAGKTRIMAAHGHLAGLSSETAPDILSPGDVFLSGHTHVPEARCEKGVYIWNPGSLSLPKRDSPPSYATFDGARFQVIGLDGAILMEATL